MELCFTFAQAIGNNLSKAKKVKLGLELRVSGYENTATGKENELQKLRIGIDF
jgi:hypothetical protein